MWEFTDKYDSSLEFGAYLYMILTGEEEGQRGTSGRTNAFLEGGTKGHLWENKQLFGKVSRPLGE